jgi:RNA polymerase sigma factor (TIGR02999 family)
MSDVNRVLDAIERGQTRAADELLPLVYDELRRLAAWKMAHESEGQTLQPTALVHEAWLRLAGANAERPFQGRTHFMAAAAEAMRLILIDRARRRKAQKRGCGAKKLDLDQVNARQACPGRSSRRGTHQAPFFRRTDERGGGAGVRHFRAISQALLDVRARLALP